MKRLPIAYLCHPFGGDRRRLIRIREICRALSATAVCIAPPLFVPGYLSERGERRLAMRHCRALVAVVDVVIVVRGRRTPGMMEEIRAARRLGKPILLLRLRPVPGPTKHPPGGNPGTGF